MLEVNQEDNQQFLDLILIEFQLEVFLILLLLIIEFFYQVDEVYEFYFKIVNMLKSFNKNIFREKKKKNLIDSKFILSDIMSVWTIGSIS